MIYALTESERHAALAALYRRWEARSEGENAEWYAMMAKAYERSKD